MNITKSPLFKNLALLLSGNAIAQMIGVGAAPILTRLYTPEQYGILGGLLTISGILTVVSSLRLEMALVLEKDECRAQLLQRLCLGIIAVVVIVLAITMFLLPGVWGVLIRSDVKVYMFWLVPIVLMGGIFNVFNLRLNRDKQYKKLTSMLILRRISNVAIQLGFGVCGAHVLGLIMGGVCGSIVAVIFVILVSKKSKPIKCSDVSVKNLVSSYYRFPLYSAPQTLINSVSSQLPVFILGWYYSVEIVGYYWFAISLLQLPSALCGQSIRQVFYREAVDLKEDLPSLRSLYVKMTMTLAGVIVVPSVVIFVFGEDLFSFAFGADWAYAGLIAGPMMLWIGGSFFNPPAMVLFNVFEKQKLLLWYDICLCLSRLTVLLSVAASASVYMTLLAFSGVTLFFYLIVIVYWNAQLKRALII